MQCLISEKKNSFILKEKNTYNQDKRSQEFCQKFLKYSMF